MNPCNDYRTRAASRRLRVGLWHRVASADFRDAIDFIQRQPRIGGNHSLSVCRTRLTTSCRALIQVFPVNSGCGGKAIQPGRAFLSIKS